MGRRKEANVNVIGFRGLVKNVYKGEEPIGIQEMPISFTPHTSTKCCEYTEEWEGL